MRGGASCPTVRLPGEWRSNAEGTRAQQIGELGSLLRLQQRVNSPESVRHCALNTLIALAALRRCLFCLDLVERFGRDRISQC